MKNYIIFILLGLILLVSCRKKGDDKETINIQKVNKVFIDHNGIKWFATDKGLLSLNADNDQWKKHPEVPAGELKDIAYQNGDELWIASAEGASVASVNVDAVSAATTYSKGQAESGMLGDTVTAIGIDTASARFISTHEGLVVFKGSSWYDTINSFFKRYQINEIAGDTKGWMYFASTGHGVGRYRLDLDGITGASTYDGQCYCGTKGLYSDTVYSVFIDDTIQWYGTHRGISKHSCYYAKKCWENYSTADGLISNNVLSIAKDNSGNMIFGTDAGASVFNGATWISYTTTDGLISNKINSIAIDTDGSLWFATDTGISHRLVSGTWTNYSGEITL